jgi:hypothetical protein
MTLEELRQKKDVAVVTTDHNGKIFEAERFIVAEQKKGLWQFGASIRPL